MNRRAVVQLETFYLDARLRPVVHLISYKSRVTSHPQVGQLPVKLTRDDYLGLLAQPYMYW